jgi:hypothetical protein
MDVASIGADTEIPRKGSIPFAYGLNILLPSSSAKALLHAWFRLKEF